MSSLSATFDTLGEAGIFEEKIPEIPEYINKNINSTFKLRYYQEEAIRRFIYYLEHYNKRKKPSHLLYHMATGSGKTLIMATNILYLYKKGYNKFIFFVDSTDTIEKTKDNFLNKGASKYLFSEDVIFDGQRVKVKEVNNFENVNENDINIVFSTIQGLHSRLNFPQENAVTYEDFKDRDIVLISDEAHHINALTKSNSQMTVTEQENINTWEGTVNKIFSQSEDNILLEFTATIETDNENVLEKYDDKIIYKYPLKQFRIDKFSKEVKVLEGDFDKKTRALQAIILSQYRRKVAERNNVALKPVVMMKSKSIAESEEFQQTFNNMIDNLGPENLLSIKNISESKIINEAFKYFDEKNIEVNNLVRELKEDFSEEKCVSVNSKDESEEKQILVNTLEDDDNQIRVVFAVDKLNEGWDVLNLFDIVRIYETGGKKSRGPRKTTIKEAQLIGRGARYYPFKIDEDQEKYKRKYDDDINNELRVLEELYYHCINKPSYIQELRTALEDEGIVPQEKKEVNLEVKDKVKKTSFWKNGLIFINEREKIDRDKIKSLDDLEVSRSYEHELKSGHSSEFSIFEKDEEVIHGEDKIRKIKFKNIRYNILRKALDKIEFYKFNNLKNYFPHLSSIRDFITSEEFLASLEVEVRGTKEQLEKLDSKDKLNIVKGVIQKISQQIKSNYTKYKGSRIFIKKPVKKLVEDKKRKFDIDEAETRSGKGIAMSQEERELRLNLEEKDWYVYKENYGTDQEKHFIKFLDNMVETLKEDYEQVYLIRNERLFQIYDFESGKPFEPDFILHLREDENSHFVHYQLFVEPKGEHLIENDKWKEEFLEDISNKEVIAENLQYKIIGLPFYNKELKGDQFENALRDSINL